jgi:hypothetical protein
MLESVWVRTGTLPLTELISYSGSAKYLESYLENLSLCVTISKEDCLGSEFEMRGKCIVLVITAASILFPPNAQANDTPNWLSTQQNAFNLQTSSDLNSRGLVTIRGVIPAKDPQYDEAIQRQQTSGGTRTGFCPFTLKDFAYPGYLGQGGIGIVVFGQTLNRDTINQESFSMRGIRYTAFMSNSPSEYSDMYIDAIYGSPNRINLNGTDMLFASTEFRSNRSASQYFLKEFTASFSTSNWDGGSYQVLAVYNDGCTQVLTSVPLNINLREIPSPKWQCETSSAIRANEYLNLACKSDISVSLLPYHLEVFIDGEWEDIFSGTANGSVVQIQKLKLPVGETSLRFRTDGLVNQFKEAVSPEIRVTVSPAPYTVKCSTPSAVRAQEYFNVDCQSTLNINGAFAYLQSFSNGKWTNIVSGEWVDDSISFGNISYPNSGKGTLRVVTEAFDGKYLGYTTASLTINISAPKKTSSSSSSTQSNSSKAPSGRVDKSSIAYTKMLAVGKNFEKISLASDTALSQCGSARRSGLVRARGVPQYLGVQAQMIQSYLNTASGWQGCLDGFRR